MKKIAIVANTAWSIYNFRLGLIKELLKQNYRVITIAPYDDFVPKLEKIGCKHKNLYLNSKSTNPIKEVKVLIDLFRIYKTIKPHIIFHYTIKPNIYGSIIAKTLGIPNIAVTTGLGYTFLHNNITARISQILYKIAFQIPKQVWFLNSDDQEIFVKYHLVNEKKCVVLKTGEGINISDFKPIQVGKRSGGIKSLLIARMLWDKGIKEYITAAEIIKKKYSNTEFQLLGAIGVANPSAVPKEYIDKHHNIGTINYLGETDNVIEYIKNATCIVLPSYREGVPRSLLEGAAMGKPIITTNNVGCKEVVDDGINGFLCEVKNSKDLADKIEKFILLSDKEKEKMGEKSRKKAENQFDERIVIEKYLKTITEILN